MRKILFAVIIVTFVLIRPAQAQDFGYPADGEAWYSIRTNFSDTSAVGGGLWTIKTVAVNGTRARDFAVFQGGKEMPGPEIEGGRAFELKVRWSWEKGREYEIKLDLENAKAGKSVALARKEKAPAKAGYWNPAWKNYLALILSEDNGFPRTGYPVHATVGVLSSYLRSPDEIRLVKAEKKGDDVIYSEILHQVYDVRTWDDPKITALVDKDEKTGKTPDLRGPGSVQRFRGDGSPKEPSPFCVPGMLNRLEVEVLYPT